MSEVSEMKKDELAAHALSEHGVELDLTKKTADLRTEVLALDEKKAGVGTKAVVVQEPAVAPQYLRHAVNNRVYLATAELLKRGDMIACDKDGKNV